MKRIKGARDLVFDGVRAVTNLVQQTHTEVSQRWTKRVSVVEPVAPIAKSVNSVQLATAAASYSTVRLVSRSVGTVLKALTEPVLDDSDDGLATPMRYDARGTLPWWLDHAEGTLNGLFGDHLAQRDNGLELGMSLRHEGRAIPLEGEALREAYPEASSKVCVFVHGLSATEWSWVLFADRMWGDPATCYGTKLRDDLGMTPLFVRYNSGRPVQDSGEALSQLLEALSSSYPVPIDELALVGHSMGGIVVRCAAHAGACSNAAWVDKLRHVFCIGAPHLGAPLEKGADLLTTVLRNIPAAGATVPAAVIDARSEGIKDLRDGCDAPLVDGVGYYAVAAIITDDPDHPAGRLLGDLLVRKPSATGDGGERIAFDSHQVFAGMNHLQLANHPAVYEMLYAMMAV